MTGTLTFQAPHPKNSEASPCKITVFGNCRQQPFLLPAGKASDIPTSAHWLRHNGETGQSVFTEKATAIQRTTAIPDHEDFFNHESD
jgi:hypothetical protein